MRTKTISALSAAGLLAAGCAMMATESDRAVHDKAVATMKTSFKERGQANLARLDQDEAQRTCSEYHAGRPIPKEVAARLEQEQLKTVKYPADGQYMGDWKQGERIAQSGQGGQYSDNPANPAGGNCYACHELSKAELSFGTIGPSLHNFGKKRGFTADMQKYAYGKVYNSMAFNACSSMPRFGHHGVLTEKQIKDVVALLMDPNSPVNK